MSHKVIDSIGDSVVLISNDKKITYVNRMARKLLGIDLDAIDGDITCCDLLNLDICTEKCPVETLSDSQDVINSYLVKREGDETPFCVSTSILEDCEGNREGIVHTIKSMEIVGRLIEEQKYTQELLRRGRMKMEAIFNAIADGVFGVDMEGRIIHFNRSMEKITGYSEDEVLGKHCSEILKGNICENDCPLAWSIKEGQGIEKCREVIVTKDGRSIPVFLTTSLPVDKGESMGVVCIIHDRSEIEALRKELKKTRYFPEIIGKSKKMQDLFELVDSVSGTDVTVLIEGETGTGKELVARAIHQRSTRNRGPFVVVNCSALSPFLLESELFGHGKGAFTGAIKDKKGKLEIADGGTLFLDEISEISNEAQLKLLRFLQSREFERVGETKTRVVDIRVIGATNRDLKNMVREEKFREDLFYRLNVIPARVPPLRERREDIPLLVEHFIQKHRKINPGVEGVSRRGLRNLIEHNWPGNVRELENAIMYAMASCPGRRIERMCLPLSFPIEMHNLTGQREAIRLP